MNPLYNSSILYGDIDGDGIVSQNDAALILQYSAGSVGEDWTNEQILAADVDGNGDISSRDAALVLKYVNGEINIFPIEENTIKVYIDGTLIHQICNVDLYSGVSDYFYINQLGYNETEGTTEIGLSAELDNIIFYNEILSEDKIKQLSKYSSEKLLHTAMQNIPEIELEDFLY
ncbi:MAG: hypothetical protein H8E13_21765 [Actinobacteria bacterium]|nr:hypothetical protein [Actinomycetota bacterium]